jgi:multiple sugar transport system ATP-binding protein
MADTAIVGLGAMGLGLASNIIGAGIALNGYDISPRAMAAFAEAGGRIAASAADAVKGCDLLVLMVVDYHQANRVLFEDEVAAAMPLGSTVVLCSTVAPSEVKMLAGALEEAGHVLLDAPVSGGRVGARSGTLTVMASGPASAFERADSVLHAISKKIHRLGETPGLAATYKVVHQLAAGVHLVAAAELLALGAKAGCDPQRLFEIVSESAGQSWMFNDRGPRMLQSDPEVTSAVDIFVKDLGLVLQVGRDCAFPLPVSAAAHQMMIAAAGMGLGQKDDSAVIAAYAWQRHSSPTNNRPSSGQGRKMASVDIQGVHKSFGSLEVIHGVDVNIADGEFVILVGPSGCGKSTLLRMIAGLESITGGEILIDDRVVNKLPPKARDIAMVFQNYALYPHMTVYDNMAFSMKLRGAPSAAIDSRVKVSAEILGLTQLLKRYPRQLSGGQRQRVAMGRAIVRDPQVFLFDEPLSNLDAKLRVAMRAEIKALHQRVGGTTIYVTHDQIEAMTMADKIVVMQGGKVEQIGAPLNLYDRPDNLFVAGFIGSPAMNFVRGKVKRNGAIGVITREGETIPAPDAPGMEEGRDVVLGMRPEHITLAGDGQGFAATVTVVEPTGAEVQVLGRHGSDHVVAIFRERFMPKPGEVIRLAPSVNHAHVFDAESGQAIRA